MATWDIQSYYYSGQGVVMAALRDAQGNPMGFTPYGNVSNLKVSITESVIEHKESQSGQRLVDFRQSTETKGSVTMEVENHTARALADAWRGQAAVIPGGSVTGVPLKWYPGMVVDLGGLKVSAVSLQRSAVSLTPYTNESTPYDYRINEEAGSVMYNDGSVVGLATAPQTAVTGVDVGVTTTITVTNTAVAGQKVGFAGFAGADAAMLNGKVFTIATASPTQITLALDTTAKVITFAAAKAIFEGEDIVGAYTTAGFNQVEAMTLGNKEIWLRFEGLNTADGNAPVVVDIFKVRVDPPKETALIMDDVQKFTLEGSVLADPTRLTGSKFFRERLLR